MRGQIVIDSKLSNCLDRNQGYNDFFEIVREIHLKILVGALNLILFGSISFDIVHKNQYPSV